MRINTKTEKLDSCANTENRLLPTFFKIILEPHANTLGIPPQFMEHFGHHLSKVVFLKVPKGPAMEVKLVRSVGKAWLGNGWKEFRERYSLEFGYMLTFEYKENSQFHVIIFNQNSIRIEYPSPSNILAMELDEVDAEENVSSDEASSSQRKAEEVESDEAEDDNSVEMLGNPRRRKPQIPLKCHAAYEKALAFHADHTSGTPFFIAPMHQSYVSVPYSLHLPQMLASGNTLPDGYVTLRMGNGKNWPVKCSVSRKRDRTRIQRGWRDFVRDNVIKEGDACIFQVDKKNKLVWNVIVFRKD